MTAKSVGVVGGADGGMFGGTGGAAGGDCCVWMLASIGGWDGCGWMLASIGGCWDGGCWEIGLASEARGAVEEEAVG